MPFSNCRSIWCSVCRERSRCILMLQICSAANGQTGQRWKISRWLNIHTIPILYAGDLILISAASSLAGRMGKCFNHFYLHFTLFLYILMYNPATGTPFLGAYSATKFAVRGLTQTAGEKCYTYIHTYISVSLICVCLQLWNCVNTESLQMHMHLASYQQGYVSIIAGSMYIARL